MVQGGVRLALPKNRIPFIVRQTACPGDGPWGTDRKGRRSDFRMVAIPGFPRFEIDLQIIDIPVDRAHQAEIEKIEAWCSLVTDGSPSIEQTSRPIPRGLREIHEFSRFHSPVQRTNPKCRRRVKMRRRFFGMGVAVGKDDFSFYEKGWSQWSESSTRRTDPSGPRGNLSLW